jgi:phosphoribosylformimino-5-aminoimidazole carboxamide ribotide isomerase
VILIPSIDLRGGRCVRLLRGDFAAETIYEVDPRLLLQHYRDRGARWLHLVDLDGARDGQLAHRDLLGELARAGTTPSPRGATLQLQVGGGVRDIGIVRDLLGAGIARVVVGSAAIEQPQAVAEWLTEFGPERVCLALDVALDSSTDTLGLPLIRTRGWRESTAVSLWEATERFLAYGLRHVLCTDIGRDGALEGPSIDLYRECRRRYPQIEWQASGGVRDAGDLAALETLGMSAAISGKALLEGHLDATALQSWLER